MRVFLLLLLMLPTASFAQFYDHDGHLVARWRAPAFGPPVDHYLWSYNITGVLDSISGIAAAGDTSNTSVTLAAIGDWAIFYIQALSAFGDTSTVAVSDTAYYIPESGIGPPGVDELAGEPSSFSIQVHPNPASRTGLALDWQVVSEGRYRLEIYDVLGRKVATLRQERMPVGTYTQLIGHDMPSGMYFAIINGDNGRRIAKFTIIR